MYKLIASDLDETLLRKDKSVNPIDLEAIKEFEKAGGIFVCSTGRPFWSTTPTLKALGQYKKKGCYVLSFNGGAITENEHDEMLHFDGITFEQAEALFKRGLEFDVCQHVYTKDKVWAYNVNDGERDYVNGRMEITEFNETNIDFIKGQPIAKCLYQNTNYEYLRMISEKVADITGDLDVSYSSNRYIEFNKKGVNKGTGLKILADMLGIDIKDTIAVGDNFNDLAMIQAAGLGIGVANTVADMKPLCPLLTKKTCEEGAIAEVIYEYALK